VIQMLENSSQHPVPVLVAGDFNGDSRPDLAALPLAAGIDIFVNQGVSPYFNTTQRVTLAVGSGTDLSAATDMVAGDFNGDGRLDLVRIDPANQSAVIFLNETTVDLGINVTVGPGQASFGNDFINSQVGQVSGVVFEDANRNGQREAGEAGRAG